MYVFNDDYGNTVMVRMCARAHACVPDRTVGMAVFKNHSLCLCVCVCVVHIYNLTLNLLAPTTVGACINS